MDIPFLVGVTTPDSDHPYSIIFDNGTTAPVLLSDMASIVPKPLVQDTITNSSNSLLPPFLQLNSERTYTHEGQLHNGFLRMRAGVYCFSYKLHINKQKEDWSVALPNLPQKLDNLCNKGILISGHVAHSFLQPLSSPTSSTFNLVASFVSAINLHWDCPKIKK